MAIGRRVARLTIVLLLPVLLAAGRVRLAAQPDRNYEIASSRELKIGGAVLQVDFAAGHFDLGNDAILQHVQTAANAVTTYYGQFPVKRARVLVVPVDGRRGVQGTTWGDMHGWPGFTRLRIGQHITAAELADDWTTTHELVHMAFPSLPDDQHWMEEGLATYVEPIARVETGELKAQQIWSDMVRDMPKGEPQEGDRGMDQTHTWGRTYWGGALFCLVADVAIRRETKNRKGLQDALRAIVEQGGTIDHEWSLSTGARGWRRLDRNESADEHVCGMEGLTVAGGSRQAVGRAGDQAGRRRRSVRCCSAVGCAGGDCAGTTLPS